MVWQADLCNHCLDSHVTLCICLDYTNWYVYQFASCLVIGVDIVRGRGTSEAVDSRVLDGKIKLTTAKRPTRKARELRARSACEQLRSLWPPSRADFCYEVEAYGRSEQSKGLRRARFGDEVSRFPVTGLRAAGMRGEPTRTGTLR